MQCEREDITKPEQQNYVNGRYINQSAYMQILNGETFHVRV